MIWGEGKMNRFSHVFLIAAFVALLGDVVGLSAEAATYYQPRYIYGAYHYRYYVKSVFEQTLAKYVDKYTQEARRAALVSVAQRNSYNGWINVCFYKDARSRYKGYMKEKDTTVYLNLAYSQSVQLWGGIIAHETSHIFFYQYTKAYLWSQLKFYKNFVGESLAYYAGEMVYKYGPKYSFSVVKAHAEYYRLRNGRGGGAPTFWETGNIYVMGTSNVNVYNQVVWQLAGQGYYFATDSLNESSNGLSKLLYNFRYYSSYPGKWLLSTDASKALGQFEYAFYFAYDHRFANSMGKMGSGLLDTDYLLGDFLKKFYLD
jgi:hypothetical protein